MIPEINNNEEILELILEGLNDLVDFELAVILKIRGKDRLEVQKAVGPLRSERLTDFAISLAERKDIAALMDAGKPYLFNEDEEHVDTYAEILEMPEGHSCLVSPLTFEDQPVGMLTLDHSACSKFSPEIVKFIGTISKLITIIIAQSDTSAYMLEKQKLLTEERNLLLSAESIKFSKVIGNSQAWHSVLDAVKLVAGSDVSVLIQGETGTGKEEIARLLHRLSARDGRPFVALNCSTLTPSLAESALFGHEKGAFTDAYSSRKGQFELADGGTLFLDEIGDLPMEVQPKLLRALQEGAFERVGGEKQIKCDVRIVAASHIDLQEAIGRKAFREDLYYRIGVFPLHLPALRERDNDVL
ncbi:MAG: sigma 54-interacting transcriptional regulator, partial [Spirochaetales bacterium]|nr:sigma 54-interacting transcriptional regulator [Spirochaetales bacterium]